MGFLFSEVFDKYDEDDFKFKKKSAPFLKLQLNKLASTFSSLGVSLISQSLTLMRRQEIPGTFFSGFVQA